jgi:hypothetical protein
LAGIQAVVSWCDDKRDELEAHPVCLFTEGHGFPLAVTIPGFSLLGKNGTKNCPMLSQGQEWNHPALRTDDEPSVECHNARKV